METWLDVRRLLHKFTKVQLLNNVRKLAIFQPTYLFLDDALQDLCNCTKARMIETFIKEVKKLADSTVTMGHLCLFLEADTLSQSPEELQEQLEIKLRTRYEVCSTFHLYDGAYWIRIATRSKQPRVSSISVIYLVHYSHSSCIGATRLNKKDSQAVLKALSSVFSFREASVTALQDKHLYSLFELFSEKTFSQFPLRERHENPLVSARRVPDKLPERVPDSRICDCNEEDKKKKKEYTEEKYGAGDLPLITKLTYQLRTDFYGLQYAPKMAESREEFFNLKVMFEGPNVLKGFQQMVEAGIATTPLPEYVANVRTLGKTKFLITSRRSNGNAVDS